MGEWVRAVSASVAESTFLFLNAGATLHVICLI